MTEFRLTGSSTDKVLSSKSLSWEILEQLWMTCEFLSLTITPKSNDWMRVGLVVGLFFVIFIFKSSRVLLTSVFRMFWVSWRPKEISGSDPSWT